MNRAQRRAKQKAARSRNKPNPDLSNEYGYWQATNYVEYKKPEDPPPEPQVPGVNCPPVLAYHNQMVESNMWHNKSELDEFIKTIKALAVDIDDMYEEDGNTLKPGVEDWSWAKNWDCKYINLRFDMRDGGFILTNNKGERICLEQLKWQYKSLPKEGLNGDSL